MSRKLVTAIAVLSFAFIGTTLAAVENIKVSGDINSDVVTRNLSSGNNVDWDNEDAEDFIFSQVRLRFDADLTEGVSAVVRLINERIWGGSGNDNEASNGNTDVNLDLGYLEMKEFLYQPLTLIVGRQNLRYGNALIVGDPDTNQTASASKVATAISDLSLRKAFDSVRAVFDYAPYSIDIIYAKINENLTNWVDDRSLAGVNIAYDWSSYNGVTEGYFFWADGRIRTSMVQITENEDYTATVGGRLQFDPADKVTLGAEGAYQFGDYVAAGAALVGEDPTVHRKAWALQTLAEYRFLDPRNSKLGVSYTRLSGDDLDNDNDYEGWDSLFEDQTPGEIINILFPNSNLQLFQLTGSLMPREDVTLGLKYVKALFVENYRGSTATSGSGVIPTSGETTYRPALGPASGTTYNVDTETKDVGDEFNIFGIYDYTEDVQLKVNSAIFVPGEFFTDPNDGLAYSVRGGVNVDF